MKEHINALLKSLYDYIYRKWGSVFCHYHESFVLPLMPSPEPFSDAELKQCRDVLYPLGYILIENKEDREIHLYRQKDWIEQKKAMVSILQKLTQDV